MATGICYTQSGSVKKYEEGLFTISPDRVKLVDIDGISCEPYIPYIYTSSNKPPEEILEDGTARYFVGLRNIDPYDIDLTTYLSYTPPDGYELVSENHKNDTGVENYLVSKYFYTEPFTIYYGTAGKTINDIGLSAGKWFYYRKKDSKVYVRLSVSHDIIINGNTYYHYGGKQPINTINLESGDGCVTNILVGLDSNHFTGAFDISFDGAFVSNKKIYLLVNNQYYDVTNSTSSESKKCYISKYKDRFYIVGWMYTTGGFDYTFSSNDWENNSLFTQEGTKDSFDGYIPNNKKAKFVVKFTLSNGYSHQDCQLTVDITTNK